jgi:hypothetical protein
VEESILRRQTRRKIVKKSLSLFLVLFLSCLLVVACGKKAASPTAGSAKGEDMLSLFPKDTRGLIVIDVHRIMQTGPVTKAIQEGQNKQKYDEFVTETGIDPQKDVYFFAAGMMGDFNQKNPDGAAVINLKYDKAKILELVQKKRGELTTTEYNGVTVYQAPPGEDNKPVAGVFLDQSNILVGADAAVKKVIDVYQKKADNIWKNEQMPTLLKGMNTSAMVWGGMSIPPDALKQAASSNPMLGSFSDIRSVVLSFDFRDNNMLVEIKAMSPDPNKNKQMADALNGFKALGAGAAAKEPLVGELLNKIDISSAADNVKISASIPNDLLQSLGDKMKSKKAEPQQEEK